MPKQFILESHPDQFGDFENWFNKDFLNRHGGYTVNHLKHWWRKVEKTHKKLREFIGGVRLEKEINLKSQQNPISAEDAEPVVSQILALLPGYLSNYGYSKEILYLPQINEGTHKALKTAKDVRAYAESALRHEHSHSATMKLLDKLLSQLGELWAKARTSDISLQVTLSTSPRGFLLLGHYGPDSDSCFRNGSDKDSHKFLLGQTNNSFVITISQYDQNKQKHKNVARCFGFTNDKFTEFHLFNYYFAPSFLEGDAIEALKAFFGKLWNDQVSFHEGQAVLETIYRNPCHQWSFAKGKGKTSFETTYFIGDQQNIYTFFCPKCRTEDRNDIRWSDIDDDLYCVKCSANAFVCDLTQQKTFRNLETVITNDGLSKLAHPDIAKTYAQCSTCSNRAETLIAIQNETICNECLECGWTFCDSCEQHVPDAQMSDIGDLDICESCVDQGVSPFDQDDISLILMSLE